MIIGGTGHLDRAGATNNPAMGKLEVCNVAANSPGLIGQPFRFIEHSATGYVGPFIVDAGARPGASCGRLTSYPVGATVHVAERPGSAVITQITVQSGTTVTTRPYYQCSGVVPPIAAILTSGTTTVTYTNTLASPYPCPALVVCVVAGDSGAHGSFNFSLTSVSGTPSTKSVSVILAQGNFSSCSGDITVPTGQVTVTEEANWPFYVSSVTSVPQGDLASENLAKQTATFVVQRVGATTAIFTDSTVAS